MTPAHWRRMKLAVAERCAGPGANLGPEAARVLQSVLAYASREEQPPAQLAWSRDLGFGTWRRLKAALDELDAAGFVVAVTRGAQPAFYECDLGRIGAWAAGKVALETSLFHCQNSSDSTAEMAALEGGQHCQNSSALARGGNSSSSSFSSPSFSPQQLHAETEAICAELRRRGVKVSPGMRDDILTTWAGHFSLAEVVYAVRVADRRGAQNISFVHAVMLGERAAANVTEFTTDGGAA